MKITAIKTWRYPEASERQLSRSMQDAVTELVVEMRDRLDRLKFDATAEEISQAEDDISESAITFFSVVIAALASIGLTIYRFNSKQWLAIAIAAGGRNNESVMRLKEFGAGGYEDWYQEALRKWEDAAEASIRKLASDIVADWTTKVRTANNIGKSRKQIDEIIEGRYAIYGSWSRNRASGIIGTFNSMLMMQRLKDAKVSHYFWFGMMDDRERESHIKLEGKRRPVNGDGISPVKSTVAVVGRFQILTM